MLRLFLACHGTFLGTLWGDFGVSLGMLGPSWSVLGRLGASWGVLDASPGRLWGILAVFWGVFGAFWGRPRADFDDVLKRFGRSVASCVVPSRLTWFWTILNGLGAFLISDWL